MLPGQSSHAIHQNDNRHANNTFGCVQEFWHDPASSVKPPTAGKLEIIYKSHPRPTLALSFHSTANLAVFIEISQISR